MLYRTIHSWSSIPVQYVQPTFGFCESPQTCLLTKAVPDTTMWQATPVEKPNHERCALSTRALLFPFGEGLSKDFVQSSPRKEGILLPLGFDHRLTKSKKEGQTLDPSYLYIPC